MWHTEEQQYSVALIARCMRLGFTAINNQNSYTDAGRQASSWLAAIITVTHPISTVNAMQHVSMMRTRLPRTTRRHMILSQDTAAYLQNLDHDDKTITLIKTTAMLWACDNMPPFFTDYNSIDLPPYRPAWPFIIAPPHAKLCRAEHDNVIGTVPVRWLVCLSVCLSHPLVKLAKRHPIF